MQNVIGQGSPPSPTLHHSVCFGAAIHKRKKKPQPKHTHFLYRHHGCGNETMLWFCRCFVLPLLSVVNFVLPTSNHLFALDTSLPCRQFFLFFICDLFEWGAALRMQSIHTAGTILGDAGGLLVLVAAAGPVATALFGADLGGGHKVFVLDRWGTHVLGAVHWPLQVGGYGEVASILDVRKGGRIAGLGVRILVRLVLGGRIRAFRVEGIDVTLAAFAETG